MGWNTGSYIMSELITTLLENVDDAGARQNIYEHLIPVFQEMDADTLEECVDQDDAYHQALLKCDEFYAEDYAAQENGDKPFVDDGDEGIQFDEDEI